MTICGISVLAIQIMPCNVRRDIKGKRTAQMITISDAMTGVAAAMGAKHGKRRFIDWTAAEHCSDAVFFS